MAIQYQNCAEKHVQATDPDGFSYTVPELHIDTT